MSKEVKEILFNMIIDILCLPPSDEKTKVFNDWDNLTMNLLREADERNESQGSN